MWPLYPAKLCGVLLPVSRQRTLELRQLSLPVLAQGGRGAAEGAHHGTCVGPGAPPARLGRHSTACSLQAFSWELMYPRFGEFRPLSPGSKGQVIFVFSSAFVKVCGFCCPSWGSCSGGRGSGSSPLSPCYEGPDAVLGS